MSIEILPTAKEPKRERGKQRVAALIDAGAELFAEKGYEATTMTEIAQRAGAAIGSLYQFFPSKEALAEALFNRYAERAAASFARVEELAPGRRRVSSRICSSTTSSRSEPIATRPLRSQARSPASSSAESRLATRCADGSPRSCAPPTAP